MKIKRTSGWLFWFCTPWNRIVSTPLYSSLWTAPFTENLLLVSDLFFMTPAFGIWSYDSHMNKSYASYMNSPLLWTSISSFVHPFKVLETTSGDLPLWKLSYFDCSFPEVLILCHPPSLVPYICSIILYDSRWYIRWCCKVVLYMFVQIWDL